MGLLSEGHTCSKVKRHSFCDIPDQVPFTPLDGENVYHLVICLLWLDFCASC